jgi:hypothetical protein
LGIFVLVFEESAKLFEKKCYIGKKGVAVVGE